MNTKYIESESDGTDGVLHKGPSKMNEYIVNALPDIIRLDKTFDEFSKATGFDLLDFNDAVIIRKKDLVCLTVDGVVSDQLIKSLFNSLLSGASSFYIKTQSGMHTFQTIPLSNSEHPFGDTTKKRLYAIGRSGFKAKLESFSA